MAKHNFVFVAEGGYFYKMAPQLALPGQTDLFGSPVGDSTHAVTQLHGIFVGKVSAKGEFEITLKVTGRTTITDDVLGETETRELESYIVINVDAIKYQYPFIIGRKYLISTQNITALP